MLPVMRKIFLQWRCKKSMVKLNEFSIEKNKNKRDTFTIWEEKCLVCVSAAVICINRLNHLIVPRKPFPY